MVNRGIFPLGTDVARDYRGALTNGSRELVAAFSLRVKYHIELVIPLLSLSTSLSLSLSFSPSPSLLLSLFFSKELMTLQNIQKHCGNIKFFAVSCDGRSV